MSRLLAALAMVAATVVWGATFTVVKRALADASPLTFVALRFVLAALVVAPALRGRLRRGGLAPVLFGCGAALFVGYACQTVGLATTTPARSAFITALSVVMVPLAEPVFGLSRLSVRSLAGALISLAGLAVLLRPGTQALSIGDVLTLGCAVAFAGHVLLLQAATRKIEPAVVNAAQVVIMAMLAVPAAVVGGWRMVPTERLGIALLVTGLLATVLAFRAMVEAQKALSAAQTAVVLAFEPVAAAVVSVALGEEVATVGLTVGGVAVVAGILIATARRARPA